MLGDSLRPMQNPITANPIQMTENDRAKPNRIQVIVSGIVTSKIAFRRPILSHTGPLNNDPIGCAMWAKLAKYDVWAAVTRRVSSGFISVQTPISDGMTIDLNIGENTTKFNVESNHSNSITYGKAANSPKLKMIRFFAVVAKIWVSKSKFM